MLKTSSCKDEIEFDEMSLKISYNTVIKVSTEIIYKLPIS